jgi:hypothetical protein
MNEQVTYEGTTQGDSHGFSSYWTQKKDHTEAKKKPKRVPPRDVRDQF